VVVDRLALGPPARRRLQEALETAWAKSGGAALLLCEGEPVTPVARGLCCPGCARVFSPPHARLFSYNSPLGACAACRGFGRVIDIDWNKVIPDPDKSLADGAIRAWAGKSAQWERGALEGFCQRKRIPFEVPWRALSPAQRELV